MKPTKENVKREIVKVLKRATTPHCADKMRQKLRWLHRDWSLDAETLHRWMVELAKTGEITNLGEIQTGRDETTIMFAATVMTEQ